MARATTSPVQGRELLIEAGRKLFLAHGYADVSMQTIAQEAGMTKGAPYYHFASKQDLFVHVSIDIMTTLVRSAKAALAADEPFPQRVRQSMLDIVHAISGDFSRWYSDLIQLDDACGIGEAMHAEFGATTPMEMLMPMFERAHAEGAFSRVDAQAAGTVYFMLVKAVIDHASLQDKHALPDDMSLEQLIDTMVDIYFDGIR